ncbi:alpha/beta-hydrolase [Thozetella sp. PMI_491]|nr:alpha/beta-hydrolase [Thozetella sp. PMI_491]
MATVDDNNLPLTRGRHTADMPEEADLQALEAFAVALGMNPNAENKLQVPDMNFIKELASLPINFAEIPPGTDVKAMRQWISEVFMAGNLAEHRARFEVQRRRPKCKADKTIISIPCSEDSNEAFDLWIYEPHAEGASETSQRPIILMLHGGGWIHGNPLGDEPIAELFVSELDAVVIGVDYRLSPEYQFPAPLDDCSAVLKWVNENAAKYRIDRARVGLWGASAGGNLAAALALRYAESRKNTKSELTISLVSLVVPVTAHPGAYNSFQEHRPFPESPQEALFAGQHPPPAPVVEEFDKLYKLYTGEDQDPCGPLVSPLLAQPTSHHPSTYITVAACDFLRSQGQAYAELLRSSGVQVEEDILPGVPHTFTFSLNTNVAQGWLERQVAAFAKAFHIV